MLKIMVSMSLAIYEKNRHDNVFEVFFRLESSFMILSGAFFVTFACRKCYLGL